ncbi:hypothetical protein HME9302_02223 [Alteripontixanthobacter maritimus]|uniref:DUF3168 domain-containing protein n=1 Tax=Alteripontixanthobacter maritimus TaxID=2161824 RepID=A0A369QCP4_9SPHN|nr:DUF3168 domain-containing protein [Alteripontixanthobacter maritimus]RDC61006.1 hypothetical protein HME9302_02223 [Alteripontixanthobacter maritimus]
MIEARLRAALIQWLAGDPTVDDELNAIEEEAPVTATAPWLGIAASASTDWSTKTHSGREIRIALELTTRGDRTAGDAALLTSISQRIENLPAAQPDFAVAGIQFLRARTERRARNMRSTLLEYRFRTLSHPAA